MNQIAIMESKIEVLGKQLDDKERELKAQRLIMAIEKEIMQTNFDQCKNAAEYWKSQAQSLANVAIQQGLISRGKYAQIMGVDRCDVDETIEKYMGVKPDGSQPVGSDGKSKGRHPAQVQILPPPNTHGQF